MVECRKKDDMQKQLMYFACHPIETKNLVVSPEAVIE